LLITIIFKTWYAAEDYLMFKRNATDKQINQNLKSKEVFLPLLYLYVYWNKDILQNNLVSSFFPTRYIRTPLIPKNIEIYLMSSFSVFFQSNNHTYSTEISRKACLVTFFLAKVSFYFYLAEGTQKAIRRFTQCFRFFLCFWPLNHMSTFLNILLKTYAKNYLSLMSFFFQSNVMINDFVSWNASRKPQNRLFYALHFDKTRLLANQGKCTFKSIFKRKKRLTKVWNLMLIVSK